MLLDQRIPETLDLAQLRLPSGIPVTEIRVADYTNWDGETALRVTVILGESLDVEAINGDELVELDSAICGYLRLLGNTLFVYFRFVKQSELDAAEEEAAAEAAAEVEG